MPPLLPSQHPAGLLDTLLSISLTAVALLRPVLAADGTVTDFAWVFLNPAGQRMLGQPEVPTASLLTLFPAAQEDGVFEKCRQALLTGQPHHHQTNYQADGLDNYFLLSAQGCEDLLVVNFTDTSEQDRSAVEEALRQSQARERQARAQAEAQRTELQRVFEQAPIALARLRGPDFVVEWANSRMSQIWGRPLEQIVGRPHFEALPDLAGQGFEAVFAGVLQSGQPHYLRELLVTIEQAQQSYQGYFNITYQPVYDEQGHPAGLMASAIEVTDQVLARRQTEQLNQALEERVLERTRELAGQQRLLKQILAQVPAAITTLSGPDHRFSFANDRYQHLVGGRAHVGQKVAEALPEIAEQGFIELLDNVYRSGQAFAGKEIALLLAQPSGTPVPHYLDFTYQPLPNEHGQTQGTLVFAVDVTEKVRTRRQAETLQAALLAAARQQAQERQDLLALFERAPVAVALLREADHQLDYYNSLFEELFPGDQLKGRTVVAAYPSLVTPALLAHLDHVYQTGETYQGAEVALPTSPPGSPRYITFTYQAYREHGHVAGVAVFIHEVTEQVLARQAVEATARQLRLITDALPVLIGYLDRHHIYRFANRAYQDWFGQKPAALIGRPVREVVGEAAYQAALPRIKQALAGERVDFDARMPYREDFVKHIHTSYIPDVQENQVMGFYTLVLDVTEQVEAREQVLGLNKQLAAANQELMATNGQLQESNAQLTRTNADLDTFVYAASHDLKAPIANIEGLLDVLREYLPAGDEQPMVPRLVQMMQGAIGRFQQTVGHLTDVTRLQYSPESVTGEVDLPQLLEDVRLDLLPLLESTRAQLHLQVEACPGVRLPTPHMRSILFNLLSNALKYRAPDSPPVVQVRTHCMDNQFLLEVQDNGLGLSEEQQSKLFTMFRRLHTHVEGSGVGLYLIKRMIELAGGRIGVHSQLGVGSTFTVTLPRAKHG